MLPEPVQFRDRLVGSWLSMWAGDRWLAQCLIASQYFDIDDDLRVNYAHLWLSLITPGLQADRRKYAQLVGNIGSDLVSSFSHVSGAALI